MPNEDKDGAKGPTEIVIHIDKVQHKVTPPVTGAKLYELSGVAAGYELYLESRGREDDLPILKDTSEVALKNGDKVYSAQSALNPGARQ